LLLRALLRRQRYSETTTATTGSLSDAYAEGKNNSWRETFNSWPGFNNPRRGLLNSWLGFIIQFFINPHLSSLSITLQRYNINLKYANFGRNKTKYLTITQKGSAIRLR